jgi:hypothetical protein
MKVLVLAALAVSLIAASPAPAPSTSPAPTSVPMTAEQAQYARVVDLYRQLQSSYQTFQQSVYEPFCVPHKGLLKVALMGAADKNGVSPAWPAVVSCKDGFVGIVKSPGQKPI